ncbi:protein ALP1-like [Schistocerca piceifrons]|uniref:protein ALP1-like n=1 Tax=Schistocerca piceifrons TaxID=274613 RepID=UPI001F5F13DA|nr:protein ALP1-like [Schistocerca piceifrons]
MFKMLQIFYRFLATGDSFKTISFSYRLGKSTVAATVHDISRTVIDLLLEEVMPVPNEEKWNAIAEEFWTKWQFPNCIGSLDGKHVRIQAPNNSGSLYWNYKKTYSIVLLALVDPCYNFIAIDVGAYGKNSDGGILVNSNLGKSLENNTLSVPKSKTLPGTDVELPMVIVGDEAFPLKTYLMRPYPGTNLTNDKAIFNYRLSRARRISENAFGILQQKFRIFRRILQGDPNNLTMIVTAACVLYNFIRKMEGYRVPEQRMDQTETAEGSGSSSNLRNLPRIRGRSTYAAFAVREQLKKFLNSPQGTVECFHFPDRKEQETYELPLLVVPHPCFVHRTFLRSCTAHKTTPPSGRVRHVKI